MCSVSGVFGVHRQKLRISRRIDRQHMVVGNRANATLASQLRHEGEGMPVGVHYNTRALDNSLFSSYLQSNRRTFRNQADWKYQP